MYNTASRRHYATSDPLRLPRTSHTSHNFGSISLPLRRFEPGRLLTYQIPCNHLTNSVPSPPPSQSYYHSPNTSHSHPPDPQTPNEAVSSRPQLQYSLSGPSSTTKRERKRTNTPVVKAPSAPSGTTIAPIAVSTHPGQQQFTTTDGFSRAIIAVMALMKALLAQYAPGVQPTFPSWSFLARSWHYLFVSLHFNTNLAEENANLILPHQPPQTLHPHLLVVISQSPLQPFGILSQPTRRTADIHDPRFPVSLPRLVLRHEKLTHP